MSVQPTQQVAPGRPEGFGERFLSRAAEFGPLCVGIDPHAHLLEAWGLEPTIDGLRAFTEACVEAFAGAVAVVKPQVAFYEAFGAGGFAVLEEAMRELRAQGVLVLADAKRGDIGTTMAGYAQAWLAEGSPLEADALTVSPWLGVDSLQPVFDLANKHNKGAIVLAATSNPEAPSVQQAKTASGATLAQDVCDRIVSLNQQHAGGNFGVVVGATVAQPPRLDELGGMILLPGVGSQGGTMADVKRICGGASQWACPNVSRAVLQEGPDPQKLQAAATHFAEELNR